MNGLNFGRAAAAAAAMAAAASAAAAAAGYYSYTRRKWMTRVIFNLKKLKIIF